MKFIFYLIFLRIHDVLSLIPRSHNVYSYCYVSQKSNLFVRVYDPTLETGSQNAEMEISQLLI